MASSDELDQHFLVPDFPSAYQRKRYQRLLLCFSVLNFGFTLAAFSAFAYHIFRDGKNPSLSFPCFSSAKDTLIQESLVSPSRSNKEDTGMWPATSSRSEQTLTLSPVGTKLKTLKKPVVLLISSDGFRFGYHWKVPLPNIERLLVNGSECIPGLLPVYPTLTFPNHYSIATGLYPAWHGIIANKFTDPITNETFKMGVVDPKWWLGEPIWETVVKNGLVAATYFWPGSDVSKGAWNCTLPFCHLYNSSTPYEDRIDTVLGYFDLPDDEMPSFISLYFEEPDHTGHIVGPDDPHMDAAVTFVDQMLGRLLDGLDERGIFEDVNIILVSDHGMVGTCDTKVIYLEDFRPWINISAEWADTLTPMLALRPPAELSVEEVYQNMTEALSSGMVENSEFLKVYLKEELPSRLLYSSSERVEPIIGIVAEGYKIELSRSPNKECAGAHGYDNTALSMRAIFVAHGPLFAQGCKLESFANIEVYNIITRILKITGAANNGSSGFADSVLLPEA
ncbi:hypothetical protein GOP47_0024800 [Adiantum capillus-veneris]|uniref:Uncharacterized protein n=1 Tax=Adiantum capillus-veneris TaxID=13818 RepID=A0A9D4U2T5_ADICA|nr:hypothetical protein GOP47_0024800 [Adiantum capillus-veneris]